MLAATLVVGCLTCRSTSHFVPKIFADRLRVVEQSADFFETEPSGLWEL